MWSHHLPAARSFHSLLFLRQDTKRHKARQFLDEEAELSGGEEGADVSSDEEDGEDLDRSLEGFVVDNAHLSQELNGSVLGLVGRFPPVNPVYCARRRGGGARPSLCSSSCQTQTCTGFT